MARARRIIFIQTLYRLFDVAFVVLAIYLAAVVRAHTIPFPITFHNLFLDYTHPFHFLFMFLIVMTVLFNHINGLYQTRREILEGVEIWQVMKSTLYSCLAAVIAIYALKIEGFPRSILILSFFLISTFLSIWRFIKRIFVEFLVVRGYNNLNVLIIGAGKIGTALAAEIKKRPGFGLKIIGFLDDFKPKDELMMGHKILGKIQDFYEIARREFINKIFITLHHDDRVFRQILEQARELKISVRVIPQGFEFSSGEFFKYNIGFLPVLEYSEGEQRFKQAGKRLFDVLISFLLLILSFPVFLVIAILIKFDSPGPVFYSSRRYGCCGKVFRMWKFRSMHGDADQKLQALRPSNEVDGPIFKMKADPRITRLGRFLRRYSLDELPQIWNVFVGEMSLVGPRPLPIDQVEKEDLRQLLRLEVRPGITGLWQIRGRSDISFSRLVRWDIWYINNWSFWLDLNILLQTVPVVFSGRGAY